MNVGEPAFREANTQTISVKTKQSQASRSSSPCSLLISVARTRIGCPRSRRKRKIALLLVRRTVGLTSARSALLLSNRVQARKHLALLFGFFRLPGLAISPGKVEVNLRAVGHHGVGCLQLLDGLRCFAGAQKRAPQNVMRFRRLRR